MPVADAPLRGAARRRQPTRAQQQRARARFTPLAPGVGTFAAPRRRAAQRAARAQQRLPARPLPHVPVIARPSKRQTQAAKRVISTAINRQVGPGTPRQKAAQRAAVVQEIQTDPRHRQFLRASIHYARVGQRQTQRTAARAVERPPTAAEVRDLQRRMRIGYSQLPTMIGTPAQNRATAARAVYGVPAEMVRAGQQDVGRAVIAATRARNPRLRAGAPLRTVRAGIGPVGVNLAPAGRALGRALAATSLGAPSPENQFVKAIGSDIGALVTGPFVGAAALAGAGLESLSANARQALGLAPIGNERTRALGTLLSDTAKMTAEAFTHPVRSFREHPLITPLTYAGGVGAVGRVGGAGARGLGSRVEAPGVRGALARAGSTVRPVIALDNDPAVALSGAVKERTYSKDLGRKAIQVGQDRQRERLTHPDGTPVTYRDSRGREVPVLKATPREMARENRRAANFEASRYHARERMGRDIAAKESRIPRRAIRGKAARDIVAMVHEGTITAGPHFEADLRAHRDRLTALLQHEDANPGSVFNDRQEIRDAAARVELADKVLSSPKALAQAEAIANAGIESGRRSVAVEDQILAAKMGLTPTQARRRRLLTAAVEHMGARHFTAAEHAALERAALQVERDARTALDAAPAAGKAAARAAYDQARAERIAVSGRHPVKVVRHEQAVAREAAARTAVQHAKAEEMRAHQHHSRLTGAQAVTRGQAAQKGPLRVYKVGGRQFDSRAAAVAHAKAQGIPLRDIRSLARTTGEAKRTGEMSKARRRLRNAKEARRRAETEWRKAKHAVRESPMPKQEAAIRAPGGRHLPTSDIEAFLRSRGRDPETVGYLPHGPQRSAFHSEFRPGTRPNLGREPTTMEAYRKGTTAASADTLVEHGVRQRVLLNKAQQIDRVVAERGMRHPAWAKAQRGEQLTPRERRIVDSGGYWTSQDLERFSRRLEADTKANDRAVFVMPTGERMVAMRAYPAKLDAEAQRVIREDLQGPAGMASLPQRLLNDRFLSVGELKGARNLVAVNYDYVRQLEKHVRPAGEVQKFFQMLNRPFRAAVLPQPRWLTGNIAEPYIVRLTLEGSGVNVFGLISDIRAFNRTLKNMKRSSDPALRRAAEDIEAQGLGGLFGGGRQLSVRRGGREVDFGPAQWGAAITELPVVRNLWSIAKWPIERFFQLNRVVESVAQRAALGKMVRRDIQELTGSWWQTVRLSEPAIADAARGLTNTPAQRRFMDASHEMLGKYEGFGPGLRVAIQTGMPFLPWALNAARFVFWTMPARHTVKTAFLLKVNDVVSDDWKALHANTPPGSLRYALPTTKGGWVDVARYTPTGLFTEIAGGGGFRSFTSQFLPQLSGTVAALEGRDPFGRPLKMAPTADDPKGTPNPAQLLGIAVNTAAEASVPYLSMARRLREGGGTPYAGSNVFAPSVKPGTQNMSALRRTFDPFRPVYLGAPTGGGATGRLTPTQRRAISRAQRRAGRSGSLSASQARALARARRAAGP